MGIWMLMYLIGILFNLYYPVLGLYIMIILNKFLREYEKTKMNTIDAFGDPYEPTNNWWIPPLAATFVGCIAMMFFTFMSSMFLDIITTLFLCFAIDKDNNVDLNGTEFEALVKEMPQYVDYKEQQKSNEEHFDPEVPVASAVKV